MAHHLTVKVAGGLRKVRLTGERQRHRIYWDILGYTGVYWSILEYTGVYCDILEYTGIYWSILEYTGVYWGILGYTGVYSSISQYTPVYPSILQYTPVYPSILQYITVYPSILQYTPVYSSIPQYVPVYPMPLPFSRQSNLSQSPGHFDREVMSQQIQHLAIFETVDLIQGGKRSSTPKGFDAVSNLHFPSLSFLSLSSSPSVSFLSLCVLPLPLCPSSPSRLFPPPPSNQGYIHWMPCEEFVQRYRLIAPTAITRLRCRPREMAEVCV